MALYCYGWYNLDSASFRKSEIYKNLKWKDSVSFALSKPAASSHAGPVAFSHGLDETGKARASFPISIHLPTGQFLVKIQWQNGELLRMFWTNSEDLACLQTDGKVFLYSMFGIEKKKQQFSMGKEAQETGIVDSQTFESSVGTGLAVLTTSHRIFVVNNVYEPKLWRSAEIPRRMSEKPSCWTVLTAKDRPTTIIFVLGNEVFNMVQGQPAEQIVPDFDTPVKQYVRVAASADNSKLAFLSANGLVQILSSDLKRSVCECDSMVRTPPDQFIWCGNDAVALYYTDDNTLLLVGLHGSSQSFPFDEPVFLVPEVDGLRIFGRTQHEFLAKVPDSVRSVYQVASTAPGALLLEASNKFQVGSYEAYDYLRMIDRNLETAINQCLQAAGHENIVESQKSLLKAASFGKTFTQEDSNPESFVKMCRTLRVLNAVRDRLFAIPLSYTQMEKLTEKVLVDRLISRGHWSMALKISQHLHFTQEEGVSRVLAHWAAKTLEEQAAKPGDQRKRNEDLADIIFKKFGQFPGVSYADVAAKAARCNLKILATMLLEKEPQLMKQVNMLLKLDQHQKALSKATESGDPDLIHFVISRLKGRIEKGELNLALRKFPTAFALYKEHCMEENPQLLKALYHQEDDFLGQTFSHLQEASTAALFDVLEKQKLLKEAVVCLNAVKEEGLAGQTLDNVKLLKYQSDCEDAFGDNFIDLSLKETLITLIEKDQPGRAETFKKEFKVTDKQFWWWKIEALARTEKRDQLEAFAKSKKPPVGYLPFIEMLTKYGQKQEAQKYIPKLQGRDKILAYLKLDMLKEAGQVAADMNDEDGLNMVLSRCGPQNRGVSDVIVEMKQQMGNKKK